MKRLLASLFALGLIAVSMSTFAGSDNQDYEDPLLQQIMQDYDS